MKYKNKKGLSTTEIEFLISGLKMSKKSVFEFVEYEIPFEQISNKKKVQSTISDGMLISAVIFMIFGILVFLGSEFEGGFFMMVIALILTIWTFLRRIRVITVHTFTDQDIKLYFNRANKEEVMDLANTIISHSNSFLLRKYGKVDRALAIEPQIENLQFLRNREILDEDQYEALKDQLLGRASKVSIGYR
jgi:hypothetical protein